MTPQNELLKLADKVASRINVTSAGCWEWQGARSGGGGYGQVWDGGSKKLKLCHRVMFEAKRQLIPAGMQIDHICRNRACCNPDHLECVTPQENTKRGLAGLHAKAASKTKTHCINGHIYSGDNTYTDKRGRRQCRVCAVARERARRDANLRKGLTRSGATRQRAIMQKHRSICNG